ncbi:hypothetical protein PTKIN_Ptkin15bG0185000 [Pterospermum kingtungense]
MDFALVFCVSVFSIVSQSRFGNGDVLPPPPFSITQADLLRYLSIENIKIDLPALFVFGDSMIDSGNNNFLPTIVKANYSPYGIDFDGTPTGRITNGRTVVDFIAQIAGLPFPPPVLGLSEVDKRKTLTGVNYGSAAGGVLPQPPGAAQVFGHVLSFDEQIGFFKNATLDYLKDEFHVAENFSLYLSKSLFFIHIGSNDFGVYWEFMEKPIGDEKYAQHISRELSKRLQTLYKLGARKFFVNNVSPLGCNPYSRNKMKPETRCVEAINTRISTYNKLLPCLLADLEPSLPGSKFVLGDLFSLFEEVYASPSSYGFKNIEDSCCIDTNKNGTGPCLPNSSPCDDRNKNLYFDAFHVSDSMHFLWARKFLKELLSLIGTVP